MSFYNLLIEIIIPFCFLFFIFCFIYFFSYLKHYYAYLYDAIIFFSNFISTKFHFLNLVSFWSFVLKLFKVNSYNPISSKFLTTAGGSGYYSNNYYFIRSDGSIEFGMELRHNNSIIFSPTLSNRTKSGITKSTLSNNLSILNHKVDYVSNSQISYQENKSSVKYNYPPIFKTNRNSNVKRCNTVGIVKHPNGFDLTGTASKILAMKQLNGGVISAEIIQHVFQLKDKPFAVLTASDYNYPFNNNGDRFKVPKMSPAGCYGWYCFGAEMLYIGGGTNVNTRAYMQLGDSANKHVLAHRKWEDKNLSHITGDKWILIFFKLTQQPDKIIHTTDSILNQWVSIEQGYINHFNYDQLYNDNMASSEGGHPHVPGPIFNPFQIKTDKDPQKFEDMLNSMNRSNDFTVELCKIAVNELYKDLLMHQVKMLKSYYTSFYPRLNSMDIRDLVHENLLKIKPNLDLLNLLPESFILPAVKAGIRVSAKDEASYKKTGKK